MTELELVPFEEVPIDSTAVQLFDLIQDDTTRVQLLKYMPHLVPAYGTTVRGARRRIVNISEQSRNNPDFHPYVQYLGEVVVGTATIDKRIQPYRRRLVGPLYMGKIAVVGPATSGWIGAPYQGQGLGRQSLEERIHVAVEDFSEPGVWTQVHNQNHVSLSNVQNRGFVKIYDGEYWFAGELIHDSALYQYTA